MKSAKARALIVLLRGGRELGGAMTAAEQEATRLAWTERDAERTRECEKGRSRGIEGSCVRGGGI